MNDNELREGLAHAVYDEHCARYGITVTWPRVSDASRNEMQRIADAALAYIRQHDGHADLQERLDTAESALLAHGYRKSCSIPACNCGDQWNHGGNANARLNEIESATADYYRNGEILLERIERVIASADGHAEFVRAVAAIANQHRDLCIDHVSAVRFLREISDLCESAPRAKEN